MEGWLGRKKNGGGGNFALPPPKLEPDYLAEARLFNNHSYTGLRARGAAR